MLRVQGVEIKGKYTLRKSRRVKRLQLYVGEFKNL